MEDFKGTEILDMFC